MITISYYLAVGFGFLFGYMADLETVADFKSAAKEEDIAFVLWTVIILISGWPYVLLVRLGIIKK